MHKQSVSEKYSVMKYYYSESQYNGLRRELYQEPRVWRASSCFHRCPDVGLEREVRG